MSPRSLIPAAPARLGGLQRGRKERNGEFNEVKPSTGDVSGLGAPTAHLPACPRPAASGPLPPASCLRPTAACLPSACPYRLATGTRRQGAPERAGPSRAEGSRAGPNPPEPSGTERSGAGTNPPEPGRAEPRTPRPAPSPHRRRAQALVAQTRLPPPRSPWCRGDPAHPSGVPRLPHTHEPPLSLVLHLHCSSGCCSAGHHN